MIEDQYCRYIGMNQSLQILNLNDNEVGDEGLKALSASSSLERIYLTYGKVTTIFPMSSSLKKLILSDNKISNVEELLKCKPLEEVSLSDNPISDEDYKRLKKYYPKSAGMTFYGKVSPSLEPDAPIQGDEPEKKKLKT